MTVAGRKIGVVSRVLKKLKCLFINKMINLVAASGACDEGLQVGWRPQQESNLHLALRRGLFYPLNYEDSARQGRRIIADDPGIASAA